MFANSGSGGVYAVNIITNVMAFYRRSLNPGAAFLLSQTTQVVAWLWMGWPVQKIPSGLPPICGGQQIWSKSLSSGFLLNCRTLHEKEKSKGGVTRLQFFVIVFISSFAYYLVPSYLFPTISAISIVCLIWKNSITAQQIGSGLSGMGLGSFGIDWSTVASFLGSPLATPGFAIINILAGCYLTCWALPWKVGFNKQLQLPWWGIPPCCALALFFTLPIGIITAMTNQASSFTGQPGLNVITQLIIGYIYPGKPLENATFKTYGYISMVQALTFLSDFKLGHYMKLVGTLVASSAYFGTAWWLLTSVENICQPDLLPEGSPWTCPGDDVFFNASVIWGVAGPLRMFARLGLYPEMNWFFLVGLLASVPVWLLSLKYPDKKWIKLINMPTVGLDFNFYVNRVYKNWWAKHTYVLSAALDAGVAFMGIIVFFALQTKGIYGVGWWGLEADDHYPLASCSTAPGIVVDGCPTL
ncbi:hypothetical protein AAG906_010317 [Vitis piasezkii]